LVHVAHVLGIQAISLHCHVVQEYVVEVHLIYITILWLITHLILRALHVLVLIAVDAIGYFDWVLRRVCLVRNLSHHGRVGKAFNG